MAQGPCPPSCFDPGLFLTRGRASCPHAIMQGSGLAAALGEARPRPSGGAKGSLWLQPASSHFPRPWPHQHPLASQVVVPGSVPPQGTAHSCHEAQCPWETGSGLSIPDRQVPEKATRLALPGAGSLEPWVRGASCQPSLGKAAPHCPAMKPRQPHAGAKKSCCIERLCAHHKQ